MCVCDGSCIFISSIFTLFYVEQKSNKGILCRHSNEGHSMVFFMISSGRTHDGTYSPRSFLFCIPIQYFVCGYLHVCVFCETCNHTHTKQKLRIFYYMLVFYDVLCAGIHPYRVPHTFYTYWPFKFLNILILYVIKCSWAAFKSI